MKPELFLLELLESEEWDKIEYKCLSIKGVIKNFYFFPYLDKGNIFPFMISFRDYIIRQMVE